MDTHEQAENSRRHSDSPEVSCGDSEQHPAAESQEESSRDPRTIESSIEINLLGYLLVSVVCGTLLALIGRQVATRFLAAGADVTDLLTVVLIAIGFGVGILLPGKAIWGYCATALIGLCGVLWFTGTVYVSVAFLSQLAGLNLFPGDAFDVDIIFPAWMVIYTVCVPIILYRHRTEIEPPTSLPRFSNLVYHVVGSEVLAFVVSLPILVILAFVAVAGIQIYELIQG